MGVGNRNLYQDWLVLAVTDGDGNVLETYTHGADLSGQVGGGAGGIGASWPRRRREGRRIITTTSMETS